MSAGLTWSQVRQWRSAPLEESGKRLSTTLNQLVGVDDELKAMGRIPSWAGQAADAARLGYSLIYDRLDDLVAEISAARCAMYEASDATVGIENAVRAIEDFAAANSLAVSDTGIRDTFMVPCYAEPHDAEVAKADRQRIVDECKARIEQVLRRAGEVDAGLQQTMRLIDQNVLAHLDAGSLTKAAADGARWGAALPIAPPDGATPAQNAGWWDSLSPHEKDQIITSRPELIANRDGVDFTARDRANRALIPRYRAELKAREQQLLDWQCNVGGPAAHDADAELQQVRDKLASLDTVDSILTNPGRHLLGLDVSQERAQAVIASGDVTTADHVAVFTPGFTSTVQGSMATYDREMDNLRGKAQAVLNQHHASDTVASVTWLGYQAPQASGVTWPTGEDSVLRSDSARQGGAQLAQFYQGLNASRATDADVTALGHSYGSTTTAFGLREVTGVDRAAFFGSPGLDAQWKDLSMPTHTMFNEATSDDLVRHSNWFGTDPGQMHGVTELRTGAAANPLDPAGPPLSASAGHSEYLKAQSTSQYNLAAIVAGHPEDAVPDSVKASI